MSIKKILIVDDDVDIRHIFKEIFCECGYSVTTAEDAEKTLEILKHEQFPVMFLDLKLPGMNGVELCREIKKNNPSAVIYAVTGYISVFELSDCLEAGFDNYFTKPVELKTLVNAAQYAFDKIKE